MSSLSQKTRFEVFKRDSFKCQYCGRSTPAVVLQVDHVIPRVEGGGDEMTNLVTSCFDCNIGKGGRLLDNVPECIDLEEKMLIMAERERQVREYTNLKNEIRMREDVEVAAICRAFKKISHEPLFPSVVRGWLRVMIYPDVLDCIEIASMRQMTRGLPQYISGIIRNKTKTEVVEIAGENEL